MKPRIKTCASIFERRGDPWVSDKEGKRDYGRNLETENPDLDQFTRATKAKPHFEMGHRMKPNKPKSQEPKRKIANALFKMHREMRKHQPKKVKEGAEVSLRSRAMTCPVCKQPFGAPHRADCKVRERGQTTVGG